MRVAIYAGALGGALAAWASVEGGFAIEMAATRGVLVFLALTTAGYVADLVVVTTPPPRRVEGARGGMSPGESDETDARPGDDGAEEERTPTSIAAAREERQTSAPGRQAA